PARPRFGGPLRPVVALAGGAAAVVVARSVAVNGRGSAVVASGPPPPLGDRRVFVSRSVVATRGPAIETSAPPGARSRPITLRALGSTFAHILNPQGQAGSSFMSGLGECAAGQFLTCEGVANRVC